VANGELRCANKILFAILDDGVIKVKCRSRRCGAKPGVVVVHYFSATAGDLLETRKFRDPANEREV
jgi:hypothetical protein